MDFARFSGSVIQRQCFDKVTLLDIAIDKQLRDSPREKDRIIAPSLFGVLPRMQCNAVALLPPDSTITSVDSNMFDLLPEDKLVAIAGWSGVARRQAKMVTTHRQL